MVSSSLLTATVDPFLPTPPANITEKLLNATITWAMAVATAGNIFSSIFKPGT